jgi:hypothetical protein
MRRVSALLGMLLLAIVLPSGQAAAASGQGLPCGFYCGVGGNDEANAVEGAILIPAAGFVGDPALRGQAASCPGCSWQLAPWCKFTEPGGTAACLGAVIACPAGSIRLAIFLRRPGEAAFQQVGSFCQRPGQPLTPGQLIPDVRDRFIEFLPPQSPSYQPATGTLVNLPTVFAAGQPAAIGQRQFDLAGFTIVITASATWLWQFGDGTSGVFDTPGGPYPDMSVSHSYRAAGTPQVVLTTTWDGEFTVDGLGPFPIAGPPVTQSTPLQLTVREVHAQLVAG